MIIFRFGITDGFVSLPATTVEFFDPFGNLIASLDDPVQNPNVNTTDDDRFLGVFFSGGIGQIRVSNLGVGNAGLEVDHLQYGGTVAAVPEPSTLVLWSLGAVTLVGLGYRRRKRAA